MFIQQNRSSLDLIWLLAQVDICVPFVSDILCYTTKLCILHFLMIVIFVKVIFSKNIKRDLKKKM